MITIKQFVRFAIGTLLLAAAAWCITACSSSQNSPTPDNATSPYANMIFIPAGEFLMGSSDAAAKKDEMPAHTVWVDAFYLDRYEVTNKDYQSFILATGHTPPRIEQPWAEPYNWHGTSYPEGTGDHPVVLVSWEDACQYCAWAGKRLPTEAEWEKAARGGLVKKQYPLSDTLSLDEANFDKGFFRNKKLMRVGSFKPNGYGLYDMAGNVWEWCQDWYDENYYQNAPRRNPTGPDNGTYRVFRGGAWNNDEKFLRSAQRGKNVPEYKSFSVGFRCARSARTDGQ